VVEEREREGETIEERQLLLPIRALGNKKKLQADLDGVGV